MFLKFNPIEKKHPPIFMLLLIIFQINGAFFLLSSCTQNNRQKAKRHSFRKTERIPLPQDTILTKVTALNDSTQSYALFMPAQKERNGVFPVIFFFDAHARGALPVKKYRPLAERYGFILAGSNNSKNGLNNIERNKILYQFMEDVEKRTPFNPSRIYVSGFSGGARIASGIGLTNKNIAGVIACGAGFPNKRYTPDRDFFFIGIAGNNDFNYLELETLYRQLSALGIKNALLSFEGRHDWPPAAVMEQAFQMLQLDAQQRKIIPQDTALIKEFASETEKEMTQALENNEILQTYRLCKREFLFLNGLLPLHQCKEQLADMKKSHTLSKARYHHQQMLTIEQNRQKELLRAMEIKDSLWWHNQLQTIKRNSLKLKNKELRLINKRLLSYLSLISYLYAKEALAGNNPAETAKYLMIYRQSDPGNPEVYFMLAEYNASQGEVSKVIPMLNKAMQRGFNEPDRLKRSRYFRSFQKNKTFAKLIEACIENRNKTNE